jgi:hypothetical protein
VELANLLAALTGRCSRSPCCIFSGRIDFGLEDLERARAAGTFEFKLLEYRGREDRH